MARRTLVFASIAALVTACPRDRIAPRPDATAPRPDATAPRAAAAPSAPPITRDAAAPARSVDAARDAPGDARFDAPRDVVRDASEDPRDVATEDAVAVDDVAPARGGCMADEDCPGEQRCFNENLEAQYSRVFRDCEVAQAWKDEHPYGTCIRDACDDDLDCPSTRRCGQLPMVPFPARACLPATCRWDAQCRRGSVFGQCASYLAGRPCEAGGWHCVFPDDPCSPIDPARRCRPVDGVIAYCVPVNGRFRCVTEE
jgi:hypothetical protein